MSKQKINIVNAMNIVQAIQKVQEMEGSLLAYVPYPNAKDAHLAKVLVHTAENEYVVWTFNLEDGGFHTGHYFRDIRDGVNMLARIVERMYE